ncbi:MAG: hypothetical protein D6800_07160 [Candidatus Zixiibacteriota bacterium]|nr:MAG: hypothetical protein D6800_07160 [candidate division Zixibacteria bacterium]
MKNRVRISPAQRESHLRRFVGSIAGLLFFGLIMLTPEKSAAENPAANCPNLWGKGEESFLRDALEHRVISIGETHGTNEIPSLVGSLLCHLLAKGKTVLLGLEMPSQAGKQLAEFMAADDENSQMLLDNWYWRARSFQQDGRRSRAMLSLLERIRRWRRAGAAVTVAAIDYPYGNSKALASYDGDRNAYMAHEVTELMKGTAFDHVVILSGALHARRLPYFGWSGKLLFPISYQLKTRYGLDVYAVRMRSFSGRSWSCNGPSPDRVTCGSAALGAEEGSFRTDDMVYRKYPPNPDQAFDAQIVFPSFSASPPAYLDFRWNDCDRVPKFWAPCDRSHSETPIADGL